MRNAFTILTAGALMSGAVFAQETSESVKNILTELANHQGVQTPAAETTAPAAEVEKPAAEAAMQVAAAETEEKSGGFLFWGKKEKQAEETSATAEEIDVPTVMEKSRELYVGGEFEQAQRGFEAIVKRDPENLMARMYLRKILERDQRIAEVKGMEEVNAAWGTAMVQRSYSLSSEALKKMELEGVEGAVDISAKFPEVDFSKETSAIYQPKLEKLFVRNTRENLEVLEEILTAMDISKKSEDVQQVEIEAKFVEISEGTLEELGFQWNFRDSVRTGLEGSDIIANDDPNAENNGLFGEALRGSPLGTAGMPFAQPGALDEGETAASGDWTTFRFEDTFNTTPASIGLAHQGSNPVDILISALDQSAGSDVLSAPRIVTKSGEQATIRVGQLHYYPEVYEVGANEGNILHVKYEDFSEKLLGVELEVTPKVDGGQIELGLNPKVNELLGWQNYTVAPADSAYTYYQFRIGMKYYHDPIVARLPIFKKREIETEVTIADGSTIGMGGLISEKLESYEDKVPVLGSLPLVGRLFRNEGERAVKRNLMIFVTAKTVEPTGRINTARSFE